MRYLCGLGDLSEILRSSQPQCWSVRLSYAQCRGGAPATDKVASVNPGPR